MISDSADMYSAFSKKLNIGAVLGESASAGFK